MLQPKTLQSKTRRAQSPEADSLRMGCGWARPDADKPWILIETTAGESHPGSIHLGDLALFTEKGILAAGGAPAHYTCTDICDGIAQGTDGMDFSLPSREVMTMAVEMHANAGHFDGMVMHSGCDKSLPAHLIAALRVNIPTIIVPGGVMDSGPDGFSLEGVGTAYAQKQRGELDEATYEFLRSSACPSSGSCTFFGTAATMQLLSEVIGLALPATAVIPAHLNALKDASRTAGKKILDCIQDNLRPRDCFTQEALENALVVHAATGGSTNALIHLAAMAREAGLTFSYELVNAINQRVPMVLNLKPSGKYTVNYLWYAGGVPRLMLALEPCLNLDCLTVSGLTWRENLMVLKKQGYFEQMPLFLKNYGGTVEDIISPLVSPLQPEGAIRVLYGNIAPEGAVIKCSALSAEMTHFTGRAKVFNREEDALEALFTGQIQPGDALVIRYEGPAASGMPEQYYVTETIASNPLLARSVMLITDGRFSGASRGPAIGHVCPEAIHGGPIAVIEDGDLLCFDRPAGTLNCVGVGGHLLSLKEIDDILRERLAKHIPPAPKYTNGLLGMYTRCALPASQGGGLSTS